MFLERGFDVDHSTLNRWVLAYAPLLEKRLRFFRKPHCGSIRIDETYVKIRGQWRYLYRAIDKHGNPVDFLLTAKRDLDAAKRFFRKMLKDQPLLAPDRIGTDGAKTFPAAIKACEEAGLLPQNPTRHVTKILQQGDWKRSFPGGAKHAESGLFPILRHSAANYQRLRGNALAPQRVRLCLWMDGARAEPFARNLLRTSIG
jgi:hypothetical protein